MLYLERTDESDVRLVLIQSRAWYISLSSSELLVAAEAPTQLGLLAIVTTGPQSALVSVFGPGSIYVPVGLGGEAF